jgi:hypothetical protein
MDTTFFPSEIGTHQDEALSRPGLFLNPELSLLSFHERVM